jgi:spoIIIJ-associated protein
MHQETQQVLENLIRKMGFEDFSISFNEESRRFSVFINDVGGARRYLSQMVADIDFVLKTIVRKKELGNVFVDINNYRKEREDLIKKLARAAAKKASINKETVPLPPMNSFERRIVHSELSMHPDIKTESEGEGKTRHIMVKPIE